MQNTDRKWEPIPRSCDVFYKTYNVYEESQFDLFALLITGFIVMDMEVSD